MCIQIICFIKTYVCFYKEFSILFQYSKRDISQFLILLIMQDNKTSECAKLFFYLLFYNDYISKR